MYKRQILAYAVEIKSVEGDTVRGDLIELDYAAHVERRCV